MEPADHAGYAAWSEDLPDEWIALDADQVPAFLLSICVSFIDRVNPAQCRCIRAAVDSMPYPSMGEDKADITRRLSAEAYPLSPDQARNQLVFAACASTPGPLDWQLGEYLASWCDSAEIPFTEFEEILRKHAVLERDRA
ncbi:MAG: hypothetical protein JF564_04805 [Sphingomonas sp.]|nr:hypothetical protein [Sphingomonas sp.]